MVLTKIDRLGPQATAERVRNNDTTTSLALGEYEIILVAGTGRANAGGDIELQQLQRLGRREL